MKLIIAYVRTESLDAIKAELDERKVHRMSVTRGKGCGVQKGYLESYRGASKVINLLSNLRIEIAVNDDFVDTTVDGIIKATRTDEIGDGKIFIIPLQDCIRIRTGERGPDAIGGESKYASGSSADD